MPKYGNFIKGDYTKTEIRGELIELYYRKHLIASADPLGLTIFPYHINPFNDLHSRNSDSTPNISIPKITYANRLIEFLREFYPKIDEYYFSVSVEIDGSIYIRLNARNNYSIYNKPTTIPLPVPHLDEQEKRL